MPTTRRRLPLLAMALMLAILGLQIPLPGISAGQTPSDTRSVKYYTVSGSGGGETLASIAGRILGDESRADELYHLNAGRVQPDGGALTEPTRLRVGWHLILPWDAVGDGVQYGRLPEGKGTPPPTTPLPSVDPAVARTVSAAQGDGKLSIVWIALAIVLALLLVVAAGVWWWWRRSGSNGGQGRPRRPRRNAAPGGPRLLGTTVAAMIDQTLRVLGTECAAAGQGVPRIQGISLDDELVTLRLSSPDEQAVAPWTADRSGRTWHAPLGVIRDRPTRWDIDVPCPRLVTLGTWDGHEELVELGAASGLISVGGHQTTAQELALAWANQLVVSPWSEEVQVVVSGLGEVVVDADMDARLVSVGSTSEALIEIDGQGHLADWFGPGVLILADTPTEQEAAQVAALVSRPQNPWAVVALGESPHDQWRFTVDEQGRVETGTLGVTVHSTTVTDVRP
ncbi:hypothetical protein GCM10027280_35550 [Micromonospora polyrhachis]|uniref:LysM domain-containing protein n=1 Tax=Micromonospora polyrhachis TaxID=1282883 RepID=A0A7W7SRA2_9ACTN|nr:hypothetical protein [Micromonospora polyrhachis]MBB4958842.1 hypothetical protein [Micromonospora polyrhachis]